MNFATLCDFINYGLVLFFGIVVSLYLADFPFEDHKSFYTLTICGFGIVQILFYLMMGETTLYHCYPLLIHLPLFLLIRFGLHRNLYVSMIAVLSAYLLCTPRKWFGTLIASFFDYNPVISDIASSLITIPLLFFVIKIIAPYIIKLKYENNTTQMLLFLLPLSYYILEYIFTVYTDLLYTGGAVIIDFLDSFLVLLYFILSMLTIEYASQRSRTERDNLLLTTVSIQAKKEIAQLSDSKKQAAIYRHDLRHHMNFIQNCIQEQKTEEALSYINEICTTLQSGAIQKYCENESVNLILSSYIEKAQALQIQTTISVTATDFSRFQITDLCSLLSNALENAIHACTQITYPEGRYINLKLYEKNEQLCINLANSYEEEPAFENDIPVSHKSGHGFGVQSMISVVNKYSGIYGFFAQNGEFRFQATF